MRALRILGYGFMALVLAGGWAFFYWQSRGDDLEAAHAALAALREVRAIDARWNDRLAGARAARAPAAAPAPARHALAYARLEVHALRLASPGMGVALSGLRRALDEKAALVERLPAAQTDPERERLFEEVRLVSTGPRIDLVGRALERAFDDALAQAELFRAWLLYYSGFLLTVLAWLVWSLASSRAQIDRINRELAQANETLEARVRERTRELSEALERLKQSEAMLVQSEKMASLGQMTAGIAHEVNTPLAYVKASLESVRAQLPRVGALAAETEQLLALLGAESPDEAQLAARFEAVRARVEALRSARALEEVEKMLKDGLYGIGQIGEIVSNLRNFSRLDRSKVADYDLHEGIESTIRIAHNHLKGRTLRRLFGQIPRIACSPSQINQVFLNLLANAAQATPESGGTITVRTGMRDGAHVAIEIADNGHGIPADVLPKIFDPFFTTKEVGKGTGLGLSICYKIVQSHGGKLEVQSKPGAGTRFTVVLPLTPPAALAA
jgi:signal transduction histidine kinase